MTYGKLFGLAASIVALGSLSLALACSSGGERARLGCPAGEQCSTAVSGLHFSGVVPVAHSLFTIAEAGTQRVRVQIASGLDGAAYTGSFDARSSDPSVLEIGTIAGSEMTLRGGRSGHAYLRIVEPGTDVLLDRIDIQVGAVSAVAATSLEATLSGAAEADFGSAWRDESVQLIVGLRDPNGAFLWDDSLRVAGHPSTLVELPPGLLVRALVPGSGALVLTLPRDVRPERLSLPVVRTATAIELVLGGETLDVQLGTTASICALGLTGAGVIAGAPVMVTLPPILSDAPDGIPVFDGEPLDGCVGIRGDALGTGAVIVAIGTAMTSVQVTVVPAGAPLTGPAIDLASTRGGASPGERAAE